MIFFLSRKTLKEELLKQSLQVISQEKDKFVKRTAGRAKRTKVIDTDSAFNESIAHIERVKKPIFAKRTKRTHQDMNIDLECCLAYIEDINTVKDRMIDMQEKFFPLRNWKKD